MYILNKWKKITCKFKSWTIFCKAKNEEQKENKRGKGREKQEKEVEGRRKRNLNF